MLGRWDVFGRSADAVAFVGVAVSVALLIPNAPLQQVIMAATLAFLAILSIVVAWMQSRQLHQAAEIVRQGQMLSKALTPYSDAIDDFKRAYHGLSILNAETAAQEFVNRCESACSTAASGFTSLTGHECRVVLHEVYSEDIPGGEPRPAVRTITTSDRTATGSVTVDWVDENTDFAFLMAGNEYFHSNDLRDDIRAGYRNSHWTPERLKEWSRTQEYPYLSTVVWPIRVRTDGAMDWNLAGFLSVDSRDTAVFDPAVVKPLGAALASVAYTGLFLYGEIKQDQDY